MRISISTLAILVSLLTKAGEFTVFEKDGYFGIRNQEGEVTVPAVYEKLGWSNGNTDIVDGVIGYREGRAWGLINVNNKPLTEQKFYTIEPLKKGYFKASVKGKFSNQLFHGVLNTQGKTVVSFHYFTLEVFDQQLLVSEYDPKGLLYGVVSLENLKLVPLKYAQVSKRKNLYHAQFRDQTIDLYLTSGTLIESAIDSLVYHEGWKCFREGYAGFVDEEGKIKYPFEYKDFEVADHIIYPIPFPSWDLYEDNTLLFKTYADSVERSKNGFWITYLNGSHHFTLNDSLKNEKQDRIKDLGSDFVILENTRNRLWSAKDLEGNILLGEADSIMKSTKGYWVAQDQHWRMYSDAGNKMNNSVFNQLLFGVENQFRVKSGDYWGLVGSFGEEIARTKYDVIEVINNAYKIKYLSKWGLMNHMGIWKIRPEFDEVFSFDHLDMGRKGQGYTVFREGVELFKTTWKPVRQMSQFLLVEDSDGKVGLLDEEGKVAIYPEFNFISLIGNFFTLETDSTIRLVSSTGSTVLDHMDGLQEVAGFAEGYFLIKKNDRWGYVDNMGRLRISNRYENARTFSEGFAAIKLRGKWGFINKSEDLIIQPYYDEVGYFHNDRCVVTSNGKQGLIDAEGNEVLAPKWAAIERLKTGNYIVKDPLGKVGFVNAKGEFLLRPAFDSLEDFGTKVVVSQNGKYGVLDYDGNQLFSVRYKEIKISDKYTLVKY